MWEECSSSVHHWASPWRLPPGAIYPFRQVAVINGLWDSCGEITGQTSPR